MEEGMEREWRGNGEGVVKVRGIQEGYKYPHTLWYLWFSFPEPLGLHGY